MKYEKARAEVVLFDNSDVIVTSPSHGCQGTQSNNGNGNGNGNGSSYH